MLGVVLAAVILFATEKLAVDLVAVLVVGTLVLSGILTPQEGLAGFSDGATIAVAGMLVLSSGLASTGAVSKIPKLLGPLMLRSFPLGMAMMMFIVALLSGFMNNTACVAVFMPVCLGISRATRISPSKLLMPLSFAAIFGGTCTLIGTSPNLVVNSIAVSAGEQPIGMFEFSRFGVLVFLAGTLYMLLVGISSIPERRRAGQMMKAYDMVPYLTEVVLLSGSPNVGQSLGSAPLVKEFDLDVVSIERDGEVLALPPLSTILRADDVLMVRCEVEVLSRLGRENHVRLKSDSKVHDKNLDYREATLVEAVVPVGSMLVGHSLQTSNFRERFGALVIAFRHRGSEEVLHTKLGHTKIEAGDVLLIEVERSRLEDLRSRAAFVVVSEFAVDSPQRTKMVAAISIFVGVVGLAAFGLLPIEIGTLVGAVLMVVFGCLTLEQAYRALDWKVILLIAGSLSLGLAMQKTGVAVYLAGEITSVLGPFGPAVVVSGVYLMTTVMTELISNAATAALMAPLALAVAESMSWEPRALLFAVAFACSASFMTPIGYQTNTMIYGPGQYRFTDFLKVGGPLNLTLWLLASFFLPRLWPL